MIEAVCPRGHQTSDADAPCAVCGAELSPSTTTETVLAAPEQGHSFRPDPQPSPRLERTAGIGVLFYVGAGLAVVAGLAAVVAYATIPRFEGVDHLEVVWILLILTLSALAAATLCFFGYVLEMLREIVARVRGRAMPDDERRP